MVLSAIAARVGQNGDRIMLNASSDIYVNDVPLGSQESGIFDDFTILVDGNTVSLLFVNGVHIECDIGIQGFMTRVVIGVPKIFTQTRGLLGIFNGYPEDDLTPNTGSSAMPVPPDSNLRAIHEQFGTTCEWALQ
jgi:hypothetical protein